MSSSSSLHRNSLGIVPVLFLIAMDEQTVSLILPYQRANRLPQNSPERRQPAARGAARGLGHTGAGRSSSPGTGVCLGARSSLQLLESRVKVQTGCGRVKDSKHIEPRQERSRKAMEQLKYVLQMSPARSCALSV